MPSFRSKWMSRAVTAAVVLSWLPVSALAVTRYVWTNSPSEAPPYTNWNTAAHEIQPAIDASGPGDIVWVTNGVYDRGAYAPAFMVASNRVLVTNDVILRSVNGPGVTTIKGQPDPNTGQVGSNAVRCAYVNHGTLSGFTLSNGHSRTTPFNINDVSGGGVFLRNGLVSNCVIRNCHALNSGGGVIFDGSLNNGVVHSCIIVHNASTNSGGGVAHKGSGRLENCIVASNVARSAGGVDLRGAGLIEHCTITRNIGVGVLGPGGLECSLNVLKLVRNSIVYGNISLLNSNYLFSGGTTFTNVFTNSCVSPLPSGAGNIDAPPEFADVDAEDYHLRASSPCIDAGTNAATLTMGGTDIDGQPRVFRGVRDMGADEAVVESTAIGFSGPLFEVRWAVPVDAEVQHRYNATLPSTNWINMGHVVTATSPTLIFSAATPPTNRTRAYRLEWVGP